MSLTTQELRELCSKIAANPDAINDLDIEQIVAVRNYLHPLGTVISEKKCYVNLSMVNWREKYLRKLHMTALVGYLFRTMEEYEPDDELEKENSRFKAACAQFPQDTEALTAEHNERVTLIKSTARGIVRQFLNRNFNFNPDKHLRGSHSENKSDPERKPKEQAIRDVCATAARAKEVDQKLTARKEQTYSYLRAHLLTTYNAAVETTALLKSILSVIKDPATNIEDKQGILLKKYKQLSNLVLDMKKIADPLASADVLSAWQVDPPVDVFHQFDRYLTNHYEHLREVVQALYNEKSDFEFGVILYNTSKSADAAREYRIQHENEFRSEVTTVESGAVTLLGPFKENRQRMDFYNKNTEIMKRMMEQLDADHKLGKDLMEKQLKNAKKKNILEAGPDAPALANYTRELKIAQDLSGANRVLSKEEKEKMADALKTAQEIKEDYEVPDDGIQVDILFPETNTAGQVELKRTKFYTQAEAPLHMQEGSAYTDRYQPVRPPGTPLDAAYQTKVIKGRKGKKLEIRVPINEANEPGKQ